MMKKLLCSTLMASALPLTIAFDTFAAGHVNYLNVKGDIVHFAVDEAKAQESPACVASENADRFSVSRKTEAGRAMYSLLITAMAGDLALNVESALDCADTAGIERALGASIAPADKVSEPSGNLYLYTGDGKTRLGQIMQTEGTDVFYYYNPANEILLEKYQAVVSGSTLYFDEADCSGNAYINYNPGTTYHRYLEQYISLESTAQIDFNSKSYLGGETCYEDNRLRKYYKVKYTSHGLCGVKACMIKGE